MKISDMIVEAFEELLDEKDITIPCADEDEEKVRYEEDNTAKLYGMEYWGLVDAIENLLTVETPCKVKTPDGEKTGRVELGPDGELIITIE